MNFIEQMKNQLNQSKTITTNGAIAYATSSKALLDFHFEVTALRNADAKTIVKRFFRIYQEDPRLAVIYLFYLRDIRGGLGERRIFRWSLKALSILDAPLCIKLIPYIGEYGRYDDLLFLLDSVVKDNVLSYIQNQLNQDLVAMHSNQPVSLLGKWLPSINTSNQEAVKQAKIIRDYLGFTSKQYRETLTALRAYLDVTEVKMVNNAWNQIDYENITSKNNLLYRNAFLKHDRERRSSYLEDVRNNRAKMNASALSVDEIIAAYDDLTPCWANVVPYNESLELLWKNLKNSQVENTLVIRDGSGSMFGKPLDVATALAIYISERNTGFYQDKFITFSSSPELVDLSHCKSLADKINVCYTYDDYSNTDLYKTMKLVLDTALQNHVSQEELPSRILIISDMQFDGHGFNFNASLMDDIKTEFQQAGYKLPKIVFWNVNQYLTSTIPMQENELGVGLVSSYSTEILNMVMSSKTDPYEILVEALTSDRYKPIADLLS